MFEMRVIANWASVNLLTWAALGCVPADLRDQHGSLVEAYLPTPFSDPDAVFTDPGQALGPPDGRTVALARGASLTLRFFRPIPNAEGPDLRIYEVGPDGAQARIAVSVDGARFVEFTTPAEGLATDYELDEAGGESVSFIRIRGLDDRGDEPGFDLDAAEALH
jgi:hypothetical protein